MIAERLVRMPIHQGCNVFFDLFERDFGFCHRSFNCAHVVNCTLQGRVFDQVLKVLNIMTCLQNLSGIAIDQCKSMFAVLTGFSRWAGACDNRSDGAVKNTDQIFGTARFALYQKFQCFTPNNTCLDLLFSSRLCPQVQEGKVWGILV